MASVTYEVNGTKYRRVVKQGAPMKDESLLRRNPVMIRLTDGELEQYETAKQKSFLSPSEFGALALHLGITQLFVTDNCSKT